MIQVLASAARGFSRSTVCWIMERSPSSARTCLARARRERGQKRVPLPPANIIGRKSIDFGIEEPSYRTNANFAQGRRYTAKKRAGRAGSRLLRGDFSVLEANNPGVNLSLLRGPRTETGTR